MRSPSRDLEARREMAQLMRRFARGGMTVEDFENRAEALGDRDAAADEARLYVWYYYDDFKTETLTGKYRLTRAGRREWAKWVLFLMRSEDDYVCASCAPSLGSMAAHLAILWSCGWVATKNPILGIIAGIAHFGVASRGAYARVFSLIQDELRPTEFWPFASEEAFRSAASSLNPFAA